MKKEILLFLMLCGSLCCFAQVKFNVQAGASLTSITKSKDYEPKIGYRIGVGMEVPIDKTWSFQTTLFFLNKSFSYDKSEMFGPLPFLTEYSMIKYLMDSRINALYLQLPLEIAARILLHNQCSLKLSAGPYISYGIGGKSWTRFSTIPIDNHYAKSATLTVPVHQVSRNEKSTFSHGGLKRFDLGLTLGADFEYKRLFVGGAFEYGLTPITTDIPKNTLDYLTEKDKTVVSPHHLGFNVHVGISF